MPELPEVETIVRDLNKNVKGLKITGAWVDWKKIIKYPKYEIFAKQIKNRKILRTRRRAKYILIDLSGNKTLIIHQKISGHLLYGKWIIEKNIPKGITPDSLKIDPQNRFIRFILYLNNKKQLGLSDLRRFAKALLVDTDKIGELKEIKELGPEPLEKDFDFKKFKEVICKKRGKIKQVLMNPNVIAGIGNIYSDEILWYSKIHPLRITEKLNEKDLKNIYSSIKKVLLSAIKAKGDSMQDCRTLLGKLGGYQYKQKAYHMTGKKCPRKDGGIFKRIRVGGRSAHFCPICQKL
jgi:formamidopyrimidine-DNA glycosylase